MVRLRVVALASWGIGQPPMRRCGGGLRGRSEPGGRLPGDALLHWCTDAGKPSKCQGLPLSTAPRSSERSSWSRRMLNLDQTFGPGRMRFLAIAEPRGADSTKLPQIKGGPVHYRPGRSCWMVRGSNLMSSITTSGDAFFQSSFHMIAPIAYFRTRSRGLGPLRHGLRTAARGDRKRPSLWYHFGIILRRWGRKLMDRRKPRSAWYLRSPAEPDSGVAGRGPPSGDSGPRPGGCRRGFGFEFD